MIAEAEPVAAELERGRDLCVSLAWVDAYDSFSAADRSAPLEAEVLELIATSAYMVGREADYVVLLERAHRAYLGAGQLSRRCAVLSGLASTSPRRGVGRATGWLGRARRLLDREEGDRVERGYLLLPVVFEQEAGGDLGAAAATLGEAAAVGERFGDSDLFALAAHGQGHFLIRIGGMKEGLRLLDEAMVAVTAGEVSPMVSGIVYCGVILACEDACEVRRAREWTAALTVGASASPTWWPSLDAVWCTAPRSCSCRARGGRRLRRHGGRRGLRGGREPGRRRGNLLSAGGDSPTGWRPGAAEEAYREASRLGREPQPGLALLWLAQGNADAAEAAIWRVAAETSELGKRARLVARIVEIMLAVGDLAAARGACRELERSPRVRGAAARSERLAGSGYG